VTETVKPPPVPSRLGVGPISRHMVEAVVRAAYRHNVRLMLVASRGQIDAEALGGGYVENWSTEAFADFVRSMDEDRRVMLCRDHGGPWQRQSEVDENYSEDEAMVSSLASFLCDIHAGMTLLHVDTSKDRNTPADFNTALKRLITLYGECHDSARSAGCSIGFEVGLESQDSTIDDPGEFAEKLSYILRELARESLPLPTFVVAQTGTKVVGATNRGEFLGRDNHVGAVRAMAEMCWKHGAALKAHNADYLNPVQFNGLVSAGVDAVNIAPEFGVTETRAILGWLRENNLRTEEDRFLELALGSRAWVKWFPDGDGTDFERAVVAGHYIFSTEEFRDLKGRLDRTTRHIDGVDTAIATTLDSHLDRYIAWLGLR
jgi:hypothetical protein